MTEDPIPHTTAVQALRDHVLAALHPDDGSAPLFSAAVVLVSDEGEVLAREAHGLTVDYQDESGARRRGAPVTPDTLFDLASITKAFVSATALVEFEDRGFLKAGPDGLRIPVSTWLPEYRGLPPVTVLDLLTHRAGLPSEWEHNDPGPDAWERFRTVLPTGPAGVTHAYSCVGYIWLGLCLEAGTGKPLDEVVGERILRPLGLTNTGYRPSVSLDGIAATEFQPGRGLVHGQVHDETAWALGGVSGNAGLFSTAGDLLTFAEMLRNGGVHEGREVLRPEVAALLTTPVPGPLAGPYEQALGLRVGEPWLRALAPDSIRIPAGHGGYTGTAFGFVPGGRRTVVLLTNRVHPQRGEDERFAAFRQKLMELAGGV
ncbi:CubicO group peptidase (beta-lactamase class C family) [Arthrobacter woluwensis]|uniref:serine hydrolase domain-containing protein n=1 Tax=Arthrobacter woluwensis TaxID=156980 RepID=UPI00277EFB12|nr:serine hydrolase domain-containing protein [Arthrobacter woluwensis]MDQ0708194.1 CubicO group peptidase (beta-lactamase class C family) [Arthrobacter woluwensis]